MGDVVPEVSPVSVEVEKSRLHPVSEVDTLLYQVATEDFKDNPQVQTALKNASKEILEQAERERNYWSGKGEDWMYSGGVDRTSLRPAPINAVYKERSLRYLGEKLSEQVVEAVARRLGTISEEQTLEGLEQSDVLQPHVSVAAAYSGRWISIPIENQGHNSPLPNGGDPIREDRAPVINLEKSYHGWDHRPGAPGRWGLSVSLSQNLLNESLDVPLTSSKFSTPQTA